MISFHISNEYMQTFSEGCKILNEKTSKREEKGKLNNNQEGRKKAEFSMLSQKIWQIMFCFCV